MEQSRGARLRDRIAAMPFFSAFSVTRVIPIGAVLRREPARAYRVWPVWQQLGAIHGPGIIQYWPTQLPSDDGRGDRSREYSRDRHAGKGFAIKRILLCALTAVAFSASSFALTPAVATGDQSAEAAHKERTQHWAADHEAMMDARCGGMKAALRLTPEQHVVLLAALALTDHDAEAREARAILCRRKSCWEARTTWQS